MVGTPLVLKVDPFWSHNASISQAVSHQKEADQREVYRREGRQTREEQIRVKQMATSLAHTQGATSHETQLGGVYYHIVASYLGRPSRRIHNAHVTLHMGYYIVRKPVGPPPAPRERPRCVILYPLTAVLETRAGNSTALGIASNAGDLEDGVDNTSNTLSGTKTGSQTVRVLVPGAWAPLQPDVAGNGTDGHGSAVLCLGQSEG